MSEARPDPKRAALDEQVLAWMREEDLAASAGEARFATLALELFAFQFEGCEPYRRFCESRGQTPNSIDGWRNIPAVPTGAFKDVELRSFPADRLRHTFRTSGTSVGELGRLLLDRLDVYEASLVPSFCAHMLPDHPERPLSLPMRILAPSAKEVPDSSLSHMFGTLLAVLQPPSSGFDLHEGKLDTVSVVAALRKFSETSQPSLLCGTAFSFVHLIEALDAQGLRLELPTGTRVMETGGFKGRSRELSRDELYEEIGRVLGVPANHIVNQYGMTELASQFYDSVLRFPDSPRRKLAPPWAQVCIVDPETGKEVAPGEVGVIRIFDLANTGNILAVETADLGRRVDDGFEVLGREPGAEQRGCSIAIDAMLGEARS